MAPPMTLQEVTACADSFPPERRTVTLCGPYADARQLPTNIAGWKTPISDAAAEHLTLAVSRGRAPYVVLVDADTRLREPDMLDLALAHLSKGVAVVAPLITCGDRIHAAGYAMGVNKPYRRYEDWPADHERAQRPMQLQAAPATCLFMSRVAWSAVGGFLKQFEHRPWPEIPFCIALRSRGASVTYEPAIVADTAASAPADPRAFREALKLLRVAARPEYDEWALL